MVLVGHAFGSYVAAVYALKHPKCVSQLLLSSPVGLEKYSKFKASEPPPSQWFAASIIALPARKFSLPIAVCMRRVTPCGCFPQDHGDEHLLFAALWKLHITPQLVVRMLGKFLGMRVVKAFAARRFVGERVTAGARAQSFPRPRWRQLSNVVCRGMIILLVPGATAVMNTKIHLNRTPLTVKQIGEYMYHLWMVRSDAETAYRALIGIGGYGIKVHVVILLPPCDTTPPASHCLPFLIFRGCVLDPLAAVVRPAPQAALACHVHLWGARLAPSRTSRQHAAPAKRACQGCPSSRREPSLVHRQPPALQRDGVPSAHQRP